MRDLLYYAHIINAHSVEMQIRADVSGGEFFTGNYIL